ncbi:hypothetical protein PHMEG_00036362, partial [Phytophthora megakarya]
QERKQTALARKGYGSLSDSEKWIVEVPGQGILSWRHRGILMKFPPGTANAVTQSFGFPDYAPNLAKDEDVQALRERWDPVAGDLYSEDLHRERKAECDKAKKEYKKLLDDRVDADLEETILDEAGSWTIPAKCCHWILIHESQVKDDSTRYTLNEQMELLDDQEPAHVQWNTCASDEDRIKHLPQKYPLKLLKGSQRSSQKNRVTMDFDY